MKSFFALVFTLLAAPFVVLWDMLTGTIGLFTRQETGNGSGAVGALMAFLAAVAGLVVWSVLLAFGFVLWLAIRS